MTKNEIIFRVLDEIEKLRPEDIEAENDSSYYTDGFNGGRRYMWTTLKASIENMLDEPC